MLCVDTERRYQKLLSDYSGDISMNALQKKEEHRSE